MKENAFHWILEKLPYARPFLFVDKLLAVTETGVEGAYRFDGKSDFYQGHFKDHPVTPGVLLTECCAQIGLVCLGIFLLDDSGDPKNFVIGMSSSEMEFLVPVLPGEQVRVVSQIDYFRFQKLKCQVKMYNQDDKLVCRGTLAGMISTAE